MSTSTDTTIEDLQRQLHALEGRLEAQERETATLRDRQAILDCINRYTRGVDRHDADLLHSVYHPDGVGRYGPVTVPGSEHAEWSNNVHKDRFALHLHHLTTHNCEIDGDTAYAETYIIGVFLSPDATRTTFAAGRYFDQLEKRDGEWKVLRRRTTMDICAEADATFLGTPKGGRVEQDVFWSAQDPSYWRPLDIERPVPSWH
jgi:hypothetical protein